MVESEFTFTTRSLIAIVVFSACRRDAVAVLEIGIMAGRLT
jgi:hypothetical protein